jgi:hypothetical protein
MVLSSYVGAVGSCPLARTHLSLNSYGASIMRLFSMMQGIFNISGAATKDAPITAQPIGLSSAGGGNGNGAIPLGAPVSKPSDAGSAPIPMPYYPPSSPDRY